MKRKVWNRLKLYEVYYAIINGAFYEAQVLDNEIVVRGGEDHAVIARHESEDAFLHSEIRGTRVDELFEAGMFKVARFIPAPKQQRP